MPKRNELKRLPKDIIPVYRGIVLNNSQIEATANTWDAEGYFIVLINTVGSGNSYMFAKRKSI